MKVTFRLIVVAAILAAGIAAVAQEGPGLTILYRMSGVSEGSANVTMDLTLRIYNLREHSITLRDVRLTDPAMDSTYATFSRVTVEPRGSTELTDSVTVPRDEYDRWQRGGQPTVFVFEDTPQGDVVRTRLAASKIP